ncbi:MAG TPA: hypothetical protein VGS07_03305 [Thermoanaerobaculia bacterium]|jgi:hypothetical protein|nr:hypothetical protein [Thermoanaerobaculia bacterium]
MRRKLPPGLAITLLAFAMGCGRDGGKAPAVLQTTPEAIFLIQDNEARCVKIGQALSRRLTQAEEEIADRARESYRAARRPTRVEWDPRTGRVSNPQTVEPTYPPEEPTPPVQPSEAFNRYLAEDAVGELAAVDTAKGEIQDLLSKVKTEAPADLAGAVAALSGAHEQVCIAIRRSAWSSAQYRRTLEVTEDAYRAAEEKLRPLYTVSEMDSQFALRKYGPLLEEARTAARNRNRPAAAQPVKDYERDQREWKATQEIQAQEQTEHEVALKKYYVKRDGPLQGAPRLGVVIKPTPSPEERAQSMKVWYPRYTAKVGGVKTALSAYLQLRKAGVTGESLFQSCEALMAADVPLLNDPVALEPPDPQAAEPLRAAFSELQALAQACHDGQTAETLIRLDAFERTLALAATALRPYSLAP